MTRTFLVERAERVLARTDLASVNHLHDGL